MGHSISEIKNIIKKYITEHFLRNKQIETLSDSTPLISGGLIDSISTLQLISFLEKEFKIEFQPHEVVGSSTRAQNPTPTRQ